MVPCKMPTLPPATHLLNKYQMNPSPITFQAFLGAGIQPKTRQTQIPSFMRIILLRRDRHKRNK